MVVKCIPHCCSCKYQYRPSRRVTICCSLASVLILITIIIGSIWIVDLKNFQDNAVPSISVSSLVIDGHSEGPDIQFDIGLQYSSSTTTKSSSSSELDCDHGTPSNGANLKYSSIDIQSMVCTIPSGRLLFDFTPIDTPPDVSSSRPASTSSLPFCHEQQSLQQQDFYHVDLSSPVEDIDDHAALLWDILVGQHTTTESVGSSTVTTTTPISIEDILKEGSSCELSVRVNVGQLIPIDYTYDIPLDKLVDLYSTADENDQDVLIPNIPIPGSSDGNDDENDMLDGGDNMLIPVHDAEEEDDTASNNQEDPNKAEPSMEWIHLERVNVDEVTIGLCVVGLQKFMKSIGLQVLQVQLPAIEFRITPSRTVGMTVYMDSVDIELHAYRSDKSMPDTSESPSYRACAYFSIKSSMDDVPFYRPALDLSLADEQSDTIKLTVNGSGSFAETVFGSSHSLNLRRSGTYEEEDTIPIRRHLNVFTHDQDAFANIYNEKAADCLNIEDDTGSFEVGFCVKVEVPEQNITLVGSMAFYDFGMAGISSTSWDLDRLDEGDMKDEISVDTQTLIHVRDETGIMNVTGGFVMDFTDNVDVDLSVNNTGSLWPFEGIVDLRIEVDDDILSVYLNDFTYVFDEDGVDKMAGTIQMDFDSLVMSANLEDTTQLKQVQARGEIETDDDGGSGFVLSGGSTCDWENTRAWDMDISMVYSILGSSRTFTMSLNEVVSAFSASGNANVNTDSQTFDSTTQFIVDGTTSSFVTSGSVDTTTVDFLMNSRASMTWDGDQLFSVTTSATVMDEGNSVVAILGQIAEVESDFRVNADVKYNTDQDSLDATFTHGPLDEDIITVTGEIMDDTVADFGMKGNSSCLWGGENVWNGGMMVSFFDYYDVNSTGLIEAQLNEILSDFAMQTSIIIDDTSDDELAIVIRELIVDIEDMREIDSSGLARLNTNENFVDVDLENLVGQDFVANLTVSWSARGGRIDMGQIVSLDGTKEYLKVMNAEVLAAAEEVWDSSTLNLLVTMPYAKGRLGGQVRYAWDSEEENFSADLDGVTIVWDDETFLDLLAQASLDLDDATISVKIAETANQGIEGDVSASIESTSGNEDDKLQLKMDRLFWKNGDDTALDSTSSMVITTGEDDFDVNVVCTSSSAASLQMIMDMKMAWNSQDEHLTMSMTRMVMGWDSRTFVEMPIELLSVDNDTDSPNDPPDDEFDPTTLPATNDPTPSESTTSPVDDSTGTPETDVATPVSTFSPTATETGKALLEGVKTFLDGVSTLSPQGMSSFQNGTEHFITSFYTSSGGSGRSLEATSIPAFETEVIITNQQVNETGNTITYNQILTFEEPIALTSSDVLQIVQDPFSDEASMQEYVSILKAQGDDELDAVTGATVDTSQVSLTADDGSNPDGNTGTDSPQPSPTDDGGLSTGALVGIIVGCVLFLGCCLGGGFVVYRRSQGGPNPTHEQSWFGYQDQDNKGFDGTNSDDSPLYDDDDDEDLEEGSSESDGDDDDDQDFASTDDESEE